MKALRIFLGNERVESLPACQRLCCTPPQERNMWRMPSIVKASSASACPQWLRHASALGDELGNQRS